MLLNLHNLHESELLVGTEAMERAVLDRGGGTKETRRQTLRGPVSTLISPRRKGMKE